MGRPKGSKNKKVIKKSTYKKYIGHRIEEPEGYILPKKQKFIGYCPVCELSLTGKDMVSDNRFECPCGIRKHKKHLKFELNKVKVSSKKEYFKSGLTIETNAEPEMEIIPDIIPDII